MFLVQGDSLTLHLSGLPLPTPSQFSGSDLDGPAPEDQPRGSIPGDDWAAGP